MSTQSDISDAVFNLEIALRGLGAIDDSQYVAIDNDPQGGGYRISINNKATRKLERFAFGANRHKPKDMVDVLWFAIHTLRYIEDHAKG